MATPDIAIGTHPDLGVVASTASGVPAAKILLSRLGFVRGEHSDLYVLLPNDPDQPDEPLTARAKHAVTVLRDAHFTVDADAVYEPGTAEHDQGKEPDAAFGRHPTLGITAAITDGHPYAAMVLRAAGFTHDGERDVYTLPDTMSHATASVIARNTARVLRQSGSTVRVIPGALADPARERRMSRIMRTIDGPGGIRSLLAAVRRLVDAAAGWCAKHAGTSAVFIADRLTTAAARLDVAAESLNGADSRLRAVPNDGEISAMTNGVIDEHADLATMFDSLAAELRTAKNGPAAAEVLVRATAQGGPLDQFQRIIDTASRQAQDLPEPLATAVAGPLTEAVADLGRVSKALSDIGTHLANGPHAPQTPSAATRADAARTTPTKKPKASANHTNTTGTTPGIARQTPAAAVPNRRR
ncbi:hypothetical protein LO772_29680 [Yinghuangia sp. ASG 101]|uniref:hypothetical protein n=1 Tax=Yinghuangia sp. ASG 101 TaxID=2896848 RepID=UPI001E36E4C2|nr:hypothetical protein [Yinghuangia sp. ASG 101]UGQ10939.1 hypothetical protein LO772_29680 [Yinghuangia sp. ASG 101]